MSNHTKFAAPEKKPEANNDTSLNAVLYDSYAEKFHEMVNAGKD